MATTSETNDVPFSVVSILEDVLQQYCGRSRDVGLVSSVVDESCRERYEAAGWLREMVGVSNGKEFPAEPSEEDFRLALRSGIVLCNVLNKVNPGSVSNVVEAPDDVVDGGALSAFQYFENIRNFLVAVEEMGLPSFEASDMEKGAKSARILKCILALKSYSEWKLKGGNGPWRYGSNMKNNNGFRKPFMRKNPESFVTKSTDILSTDQPLSSDVGQDPNKKGDSKAINALVRSFIANGNHEDIPDVVESVLNKVMEEVQRLSVPNEMMKSSSKPILEDDSSYETVVRSQQCDVRQHEEAEENSPSQVVEKKFQRTNYEQYEKEIILNQQKLIQELKQTLKTTNTEMKVLQMKYQEDFFHLGKHVNGLAYAANGYKRVLDENRKLYNLVQDLKGNIRVYCRVKPFMPGQPTSLGAVEHIDEGTVMIRVPSKYGKAEQKPFTFNKVFGPSATQEEVFSDMQPLVRSVLDGYNVCIFAYGQTGSGKTFTMTGPKELTEESLGVNYRALADLFLLSHQRKDTTSYEVSVQMLEIYNEQVRDLLATDGQTKRLEIRNNSHNGINVPEASLVPVSSTDDVIRLMDLGQKNRAVSSTAMNDRSSRSHSCVTVHVQGRDLTSGTVLHGSMHLVDLAGSERVDKSGVTGDGMKEAQHINKSLSALGDVISSLSQKNSHVPYRNSKLTQLLQDSLGGSAKTLMFVHISPEADTLGETISTLKFAERVGTVELGAARVNKDNTEVKQLKEQIGNLKMAQVGKRSGNDVQPTSIPVNRERIARRRSLETPSTRSKLPTMGNTSRNSRPQIMELSGPEDLSDTTIDSRRHTLDLHELMKASFRASSSQSPNKSGEWIDEHEESIHDQDLDSLENFYQSMTPEQSLNGGKQDYEVQSIARSDSSDSDLLWGLNVQENVPRVSNIQNSANPKPKKIQTRTSKLSETRSMIPSLIPAISKTRPNTLSSSQPQRLTKDGRRRLSLGT